MKNAGKYFLSLLILFLLSNSIYGKKINTICIISSSDAEPYRLAIEGFKETMKNSLNVEFFDYVIKDKDTDFIVLNIEKNKPDLLFVAGSKAYSFATDKFKGKKTIYCMVLAADGVKDETMAGLLLKLPDEYKLIETKKILPSAENLGIIYSNSSLKQFEDIQKVCDKIGLNLKCVKIEGEAGFQKALDTISDKIDFFIMVTDSVIFSPKIILSLFEDSIENKFPVIGLSSFYTKAGAFVSFDFNYRYVGVDAARLALGKFFPDVKNIKAEDEAGKFGYSVNALVAQRIGIRLPPEILQNAAEVFGK